MPTAIGSTDQDLGAGTTVGEYRIDRVLGKGGFGTVYGAVQPVIGKQVAVKVLARKYSADEDVVSRFVAEARAVNQIRHRNIIDIFSFGQLPDGRHYYVMEYLDGEPLDVYLRNHGPLPLDEAIPVLRSIARALDAAHAKGIAHRDLKPENIFLANDPDGGVFPKLLDFGIAKLMAPDDDVRHRTNTGVPIGTPYYMSPEQCRGKDVDHRTDIYSFGIVTYRLLTGTFPFEGDDYMELLIKQMNDEPPAASTRNPELPPSVDEAIAWMMRKDRAQRPPSVIEGVNALDPTAAVTPSIPRRSSRPTVQPAHVLLPDALAATITPEFERPAIALPTAPRGKGLLYAVVGALVVLAAVAGALVVMSQTNDNPAAAPVQAAPTPAPTPAPVVVPPPVGEEPTATVVVPEPTTTATTRKRKNPPQRPAAGKREPDPDRPSTSKGDIIELGSDTFKETR